MCLSFCYFYSKPSSKLIFYLASRTLKIFNHTHLFPIAVENWNKFLIINRKQGILFAVVKCISFDEMSANEKIHKYFVTRVERRRNFDKSLLVVSDTKLITKPLIFHRQKNRVHLRDFIVSNCLPRHYHLKGKEWKLFSGNVKEST